MKCTNHRAEERMGARQTGRDTRDSRVSVPGSLLKFGVLAALVAVTLASGCAVVAGGAAGAATGYAAGKAAND